jgi:flavin-dependent dehydrogenase
MRALRRFPYLAGALSRISTRNISRLHMESPAGECVDLESAEPAALMIRRIEFDDLLVRLALEAGAEFVGGVEITQATHRDEDVVLTARDGSTFRAPYVVAADGANSAVARRLGLNKGWKAADVALDMMEETPFDALRCADPDLLWVAYGYKKSKGYAYVFPKRTHVNVGIGYVLEHYRNEIDSAPYELQERFVGALCTGGVLDGRSDRTRFTPALIPVGGPLTRTSTDRVIVVGDAGGFVNGFTAEGIYYAMVTGHLAARALASGTTRAFARLWQAEIGSELRDSVLVQRFLFCNLARIDAMVRGARRHPAIASAIVDYAIGNRSYFEARQRLILRFPWLVLRVLFDIPRTRRGIINIPSQDVT